MMFSFGNRGKRIKPGDKSLLCNFALLRLIPVLLLVFMICNIPMLFSADWSLSFLAIIKHFKLTMIVGVVLGLAA